MSRRGREEFRRRQVGELFVAAVILVLVVAIVAPNGMELLGTDGDGGPPDPTELQEVQAAVYAMLADNGLNMVPNPVGEPTSDMALFPDHSSPAGSAWKSLDRSAKAFRAGLDGDGYVLFGHDGVADGSAVLLTDYVGFRMARCFYGVDVAGNVTQNSCP
jgi:hypothetical protein